MNKFIRFIIFTVIIIISLNNTASAKNGSIQLTEEEQNWLAQNHVVRARVGKAPPLHFHDVVNQGISVDFLNLIANRIGFKVEYVNDISWSDALEDIKINRTIDLILTAKNVKERQDFMLFTDEYLFMPWVIFTREKGQFVSSIDDLSGKTVSVEKNFVIHKKLDSEFPSIQLVVKETSLAALQAVATGEADAHIGNLTISTYIIQNNHLTNLKVSCPTPFDNHNQSFALRKDWPELASIINKALQTITPQENAAIRNSWLSVKYEYGLSKTDLVKWILIVIAFCGIFLMFFVFWNRKLKHEIDERKKADYDLRQANHSLGERVKELNCLYGLSNLVGRGLTIEEILQGTTDLILPSMQYPEITCAQIKLDNQTYKTDKYTKTKWLLSKEIIILGKIAGVIEVYYLEERPEIDEGPFLKEEKDLINDIAERMGHIIERMRAEQRQLNDILLSEKYIRSLPGLFYVFDEQRFVKWNAEWETVTGYSAEELGTKYGTDFFEGKDKTHIEEQMLKVFRDGLADADAELVTKAGKRIPYYFTGVRENIDGKDHLVGLGIDITARKQAEEEKSKLESQLRQSHKMEAIGTMAGGIAHDFNNILAAILGYADLAKSDISVSSPANESIEQIKIAGHRATELVRHILSFSRMENKFVGHIPIQLSSIVKEVLKFQRSVIPSTISIIPNIDESYGLINGDTTQVHQVIMNFCSNASHAMEEIGGIIKVDLQKVELSSNDLVNEPNRSPGSYLMLSVSDTGTGLDPELRGKIFDPYFTTKEVGKGSGLGLSVVHGIMKSHGGLVKVDSEFGKGSTFSVFFPMIKSEFVELDIETDGDIPTGTEKILFIDDESMLVDIGKSTLEKLGYLVTAKTDSTEALNLFKSDPSLFDLVITDQTMPNISGSQLANHLIQVRPDIPIILCTGHSDTINEIKAQEIGIKEYTMKPVSKKDIAKLVRKVLDAV